MAIKVLIADDHALFREGLASLISSKDDYEVIGQAENGKQVVEKFKQLQPELVLMDITMPEQDGVTATKEIISYNANACIIILTMSEEAQDVFAALEAGAKGYLLKSSPPSDLFYQLEKVVKGNVPVTDPMTGKILTKMINQHQIPDNCLSHRELEVMTLVAQGLSNKEIATKLFISENTVKKHVSNIMAKLGLENRTQLARYAMKIHRSQGR